MVNDVVSDMIARIKNAQLAGFLETDVLFSSFSERILSVLLDEGYIGSFVRSDCCRYIKVCLKYFDGLPVIKELKRVSKCSRRVYSNKSAMPQFKDGLGINIVTTSQGVMSDKSARKIGIGGEIICSVF